MSDAPQPIKQIEADSRHEQFYQAIVDAMITLHISDNEGTAVMGRMLGYHRATNPAASSVPELVNTFRWNIREAERAFRAGEIRSRESGAGK